MEQASVKKRQKAAQLQADAGISDSTHVQEVDERVLHTLAARTALSDLSKNEKHTVQNAHKSTVGASKLPLSTIQQSDEVGTANNEEGRGKRMRRPSRTVTEALEAEEVLKTQKTSVSMGILSDAALSSVCSTSDTTGSSRAAKPRNKRASRNLAPVSIYNDFLTTTATFSRGVEKEEEEEEEEIVDLTTNQQLRLQQQNATANATASSTTSSMTTVPLRTYGDRPMMMMMKRSNESSDSNRNKTTSTSVHLQQRQFVVPLPQSAMGIIGRPGALPAHASLYGVPAPPVLVSSAFGMPITGRSGSAGSVSNTNTNGRSSSTSNNNNNHHGSRGSSSVVSLPPQSSFPTTTTTTSSSSLVPMHPPVRNLVNVVDSVGSSGVQLSRPKAIHPTRSNNNGGNSNNNNSISILQSSIANRTSAVSGNNNMGFNSAPTHQQQQIPPSRRQAPFLEHIHPNHTQNNTSRSSSSSTSSFAAVPLTSHAKYLLEINQNIEAIRQILNYAHLLSDCEVNRTLLQYTDKVLSFPQETSAEQTHLVYRSDVLKQGLVGIEKFLVTLTQRNVQSSSSSSSSVAEQSAACSSSTTTTNESDTLVLKLSSAVLRQIRLIFSHNKEGKCNNSSGSNNSVDVSECASSSSSTTSSVGQGVPESVHTSSSSSSSSSAAVLLPPSSPLSEHTPAKISKPRIIPPDGSHWADTYLDEVYEANLNREQASSPRYGYMEHQTQINEKMRAILIDWIVEVHNEHRLHPETFFLTINLIDRYLEVVSVRRAHLQLVGVAALWIASKHEEEWQREVGLSKLVAVAGNAYTKQEIQNQESDMLTQLSFRVCVPTVYTFLTRLLAAAMIEENSATAHLATFIAEICAARYRFLRHLPSTVAAAALNMALRTTHGPKSWSTALETASGVKEEDMRDVIIDIQTYAFGTSSIVASANTSESSSASSSSGSSSSSLSSSSLVVAMVAGTSTPSAATAIAPPPVYYHQLPGTRGPPFVEPVPFESLNGILRKYSHESRYAVALQPIAALP